MGVCVKDFLLVFSYMTVALSALAGVLPMPTIWVICSSAVSAFFAFLCIHLGQVKIKIGAVELTVAVYMLVIFTSGVFSSGGVNSLFEAMTVNAIWSVYFLLLCIGDTRNIIKIMIAFSFFAAVFGFVQLFSGGYESGWLDSTAFSNIKTRISSAFGNPNMYAAYLIIVIPFAISSFFMVKNPLKKVLVLLLCFMLIFSMVQTWSRGAWVGFAVAIAVYFILCSKKAVFYILTLGSILLSVITVALPNVSHRLFSLFDRTDSSASYRISAWKNTIEMLKDTMFFGVGIGESSFLAVYPRYSYFSAAAVRHSHNLYLQILCETGWIGLLAFFITISAFLMRCFYFLNLTKEKEKKYAVVSGVAAVLGILVMGVGDYIFYNNRILLAFVTVLGISSSCILEVDVENECEK